MPLAHWSLRFKTKIKDVNLFEDIEKTNEENIKNQQISTVVFLVIFTLSIVALFIYSSLTPVTKTVVVEQPSWSNYKQLEEKYPNTLVCPCTSISHEYNKFISSFTPTFNQICSSDFVSDNWLNYVNYRPFTEAKYQYNMDFRHSGYSFFAMLRTLCALTSQTINDQLIIFYSTVLLTENVISDDTFSANVQAGRDQFIAASINQFLVTLDSFLAVVQANNAINRIETNYQFELRPLPYNNYKWLDSWYGQTYPPDWNCDCSTSILCSGETAIFVRKLPNETTSDLLWGQYMAESQFVVSGVRLGCVILTAVLQSDLACLYNQTCLSELNTYLNDSLSPFNATSLIVFSSSSSSLPTMNDLVDKLMVDLWNMNSSFEHYFSSCNPSTCIYTYVLQPDFIFIITTVIAFIGGIVTILMILTLPTVTFLRKKIKAYHSMLPSPEAELLESNPERRTTVITTDQRIRPLAHMKSLLLNLNFFSDPEQQTEWYLYGQRLSTRLFIVSMIVAVFILVLYTALSPIIKTINIKQPSIDIYLALQDEYSQTLNCPCSSISNEYKQFISFHPTFHPVCDSDFITDNWAQYIIPIYNDFPEDFRFSSETFFPTIAAFCQLSLKIINNQLVLFNSTKYVTKYVQQVDLFQTQTGKLISNMEQTTANSFQLLLSMLRQTVWGNALFAGVSYSYMPDPTLDNGNNSSMFTKTLNQVFYPAVYNPTYNTICSCKLQAATCGQLDTINVLHNDSIVPQQFTIPGYYIGCFPIESMFQSDLECFINETCLQIMNSFIYVTSRYPYNATVMQLNNSHYNATTNLQYIVDSLMIEEWNNQTTYYSYFEQCNPYLCTYSYNSRRDISDIFAITIGLIGGLTTILKLIIPLIVTIIRQWRDRRKINVNLPMVNEDIQTTTKRQKMKAYILTFNLLKNRNKRSDQQLQHQRISTYVFLVIILISLFILLFYVSFENVSYTITKENPTIDEFNKLYQQYPNTLQCPCKTLSIAYEQFITFQPRLHSICSSEFISQTSQWLIIDYPRTMLDIYGRPTYSTRIDDFRQIASPFFQLFNSFCTLSSQTITAELLAFNSNTFITLNLITFEQFQTQINQLIIQFVQNIARSFVNILYFTQNMTSANMFLSALSTDSTFTSYPDYFPYEYEDYPVAYVYDRRDQVYNSSKSGIDCDCQETAWCVQPTIVYDLDTKTKLFSPRGLFVGCYLIEAVLQSDLSCFFDVDCLQELANSLYLVNVNASDIVLTNLTTTTTSRYHPNSQLLEIVSNLMVEEWNNQTSYDNYFKECQPSVCTATYIVQGNIVYIVTTIIGLIGGLTKVYKFTVPIMVKIIMRFIIPFLRKRCNTRNHVDATQNV